MRFLLNMNLPRSMGQRLAEIGHEYRHVADLGMAQADDVDIVETARASGEVILTHDLDYGHLLSFSGASKPSVVIFRIRNASIDHLVTLIQNALPQITEPLENGVIVILEDSAIRIRRLPVSKQY